MLQGASQYNNSTWNDFLSFFSFFLFFLSQNRRTSIFFSSSCLPQCFPNSEILPHEHARRWRHFLQLWSTRAYFKDFRKVLNHQDATCLGQKQSWKKCPYLRACSWGRISELGKIWGRRQEEKNWKSYNFRREKNLFRKNCCIMKHLAKCLCRKTK